MTQPRAQLLLPLSRATFLDAYFSRDEEGGGGGLFVPGDLDVQLGDEVDVELRFAEDQVRFHIRATVRFKRQLMGRRALPPGVGIEFLPSEESTAQQILRYAEGKESVNHVERDRRWALQVDVKLKHDGQELTAMTDDISEGGCFVVLETGLEVGHHVDVRLRAPGMLFGWLTLPGYVTWRRAQASRNGVGIEFRFETDRQRNKVKKILDVLKQRSLRDVTIKVPRTQPPAPTRI